MTETSKIKPSATWPERQEDYQVMGETKPTYSKEALRAAIALHKKIGWTHIEKGTLCIGVTSYEAAQIIYEETRQEAQQELLEAAKAAAQAIEAEVERSVTKGKLYLKCALDIHRERLQAAIAKIEVE